ncbi:MAG TPA: hypothetical protein VKE40_10035 [Gemmataceae bacterium]|nr:hypothetical protein [Gemmataceae bacterium]
MRFLLTVAAIAALSTPALACINDTELNTHEREFKSQYQESQYEPPQPEEMTSARPYLLAGTGLLLTAIGTGLFLRRLSR